MRREPLGFGEILNCVGVEERIKGFGVPGDCGDPVAPGTLAAWRRFSTIRASRKASRNATFHSPTTG